MFTLLFSIALLVRTGLPDGTRSEAQILIDTIESLQQPIKDFRCEFEGTQRFQGEVSEALKKSLNGGGRGKAYSGVFLWKKGGDTYLDSLQRQASDGQIERVTLVVRMRENHAEIHHRFNDASIGSSNIRSPKENNSWNSGSLGLIFLIDKLKRDVADGVYDASVQDDELEGRPLKILTLNYKKSPDPVFRYWIDLRRNGQVIREEAYSSKKVVRRVDIKLAPFKVGDDEVWMPVAGEKLGYARVVDKKSVITKEPASIESIYVVDGTMEFNKNPGPEAFTMKYKLGTPISDHRRQLETEFGRHPISTRPTKREAESMLIAQVAQAEEQKSELVVAPTSGGVGWPTWVVAGLAGVVGISLVAFWIQKRSY